MTDPSIASARVLELAEEYLDRYRKGQLPDLEEYITRYPELADAIREVFPAMAILDRAGQTDGSEVGASAPKGRTQGLRKLGDYRILREIGQGGMGVVYEAEQISLGRHVALKVLPERLLRDPKQRRRFEREAKAAARLHHTNIVPVFGVGEDEGIPYYAMQFISGLGMDLVIQEVRRERAEAGNRSGVPIGRSEMVTAADLARSLLGKEDPTANRSPTIDESDPLEVDLASPPTRSRPPEPDSLISSSASLLVLRSEGDSRSPGSTRPTYWRGIARIGAQVADALAYAHSQGVLHRDIKPSNLLLDSRGVIWVADFGLAKIDDRMDLTHTGDILGTLRYMPPEAFEGRHEARGDIYSLGLSLYEMLAFRPAFDENDRGRLIRQVTAAEVPRLRSINPDVPRDLETIVHKAIEREPSNRYGSSADLAEDLRRYFEDRPILARRASEAEKFRRWCRRNPAVASLAAVLLGVLISTTLGSLIVAREFLRQALVQEALAIEKEGQRQVAVAERQKADAAGLAALSARNQAMGEAYRASLSEARALRLGQPSGWRSRSLEILTRLAGQPIPGRNLVELRSEAVDSLSEIDFEEVARLHGDPEIVQMLAFGPDDTLATIGENGTLRVWDIKAGRSTRRLVTSRRPLWIPTSQLHYSPRNGVIVFLTKLGELAWLGAAAPPQIPAMGPIRSFEINRLDDRMAVVTHNRVRVHDLPGGNLVLDRKTRDGVVALTPDGSRLAMIDPDGTVRVTDLGDPLTSRPIDRLAITCKRLEFCPDGSLLASGDDEGMIRVWSVDPSKERMALRGHQTAIRALVFSPDGRWLATSGEDLIVRVWEARTGRLIGSLQSGSREVMDLAFSPDGKILAVATADGYSVLYAVRDRESCRHYETQQARFSGVAFDSHRPRVYAAIKDTRIVALNLITGKEESRSSEDTGRPWNLALSPDSAWLMTGQMSGHPLRLFGTKGDGTPRFLGDHPDSRTIPGIEAIAFDPTSTYGVSGSAGGSVVLWRISDLKPVWIQTPAVPYWIDAIGFIKGGKEILVGSQTGGLEILETQTGRPIRSVLPPGGADLFVISPAGDRLWVCTYAQTLRTYRLPGLEELRAAPFDQGQIRGLALSPDGTMLCMADGQGRITILDPETLRPWFALPVRTRWIEQIGFDPTSRLLGVAGNDAELPVWDLGQIRANLAELGLGADLPPPSGSSRPSQGLRPARVRILLGEIDPVDLDEHFPKNPFAR